MNLETIDFAHIAANEQRAESFRRYCYDKSRETPYRLLSRAEANTKIRKSRRVEYRIVSLSLSHAATAGGKTNCPQASRACMAACVGSDNVGLAQAFGQIMEGRIRKTRMMQSDLKGFLIQLIGELEGNRMTAERQGAELCARLNQFSDLPWEKPAYGMIPTLFPMVTFYDYTKIHNRVSTVPENYHLCGSWSELERHQRNCVELLRNGFNVAIAFSTEGAYAGNRAIGQQLPKRHKIGEHWFECYDGDASDLRFLDPGPTRRGNGRICALRLKAGNNVSRDMAIAGGFSVHSN